jgi:phage N-6-adenine-methyltransferase
MTKKPASETHLYCDQTIGYDVPVGPEFQGDLMEKTFIHFSSKSVHWSTPRKLFEELNNEFHFDYDPCPLRHNSSPLFGGVDGLTVSWGKTTFCNPPYGRTIGKWIEKGYMEAQQGKVVVMLIPSRTDTAWWHDYVMKATEIRYIRGRLKFGDAKNSAPFPSAIVIFGDKDQIHSKEVKNEIMVNKNVGRRQRI